MVNPFRKKLKEAYKNEPDAEENDKRAKDQDEYINKLKEAYKNEPDEDATQEEIKMFMESDSKYNSNENVNKVPKEKANAWKKTLEDGMKDNISRIENQKYISALELIIKDEEITNPTYTDDATFAENLADRYQQEAEEAYQDIINAFGINPGEDVTTYCYFYDVLKDQDQYTEGLNEFSDTETNAATSVLNIVLNVITTKENR